MFSMPWYTQILLPDMFKNKICRYLLQRYLGQFLEEKLTLEQLKIDFTNGTGTIYDVTLYCQALNEICEAQDFGIEVIDGRIGSVTVTIPWNALMTDDSYLHVNNLFIAIKPHTRTKDDGASMLESVWSSMSSSMQLAQECLDKENDPNAQANVMMGLEKFAQTIDNILNRVKARLTNTEIRLEYLPPNSDRGIALIIKIENIEYENEAGSDPPDKECAIDGDQQSKQKTLLLSTHATHHVIMEGITFYTEEFRIHNIREKSTPVNESSVLTDQFYSTISSLPETEQFYPSKPTSAEQLQKENENSDCEDEISVHVYRSEPIAVAKLLNRQEFRIKMKQADNIPGPKVQLDITFGSLTMFISPRQLHLLIRLADVMLNDEVIAEKNDMILKENQSPMDIDFRRESSGIFNPMSGGLGFQAWSNDNFNETFDSLLPTINPASLSGSGVLSDSVISETSSMTSSITSSVSHTTSGKSGRKNRRRKQIDLYSNADISDFNVRIACLSVVLVHEDVLLECPSPLAESPLSEQSVQKLKLMSDHYFNTVSPLNIGLAPNEMKNAVKLLETSCHSHHLRLLAAPIILVGEEQRNTNGIQLRITTTIGRFDFSEVLDNKSCPILSFLKYKSKNHIRPDVKIDFSQLQRAMRGVTRRFAPPKTDINLSLGGCELDFDISLMDRVSGLFNNVPFIFQSDDKYPRSADPPRKNEAKLDIAIETSTIDFRLRFPIADLRPIHDPQRVPWWERNIRSDFLLLSFVQCKIQFSPAQMRFEITSNEIDVYYCESINSGQIHIAKAKMQENPGSRYTSASVEYPKIVLEFPTNETLAKNSLPTRHSDDDSGASGSECTPLEMSNQLENSPFTSKRICRESDTPHSKATTDDVETLLIPGDRIEMGTFCDSAMKRAKVQININLPTISLQLKSKHLYEIIYNRINSDLLMWEPSAPSYQTSRATQMATSLLNVGMAESLYVPFSMCKSGINYESSSSTTASESESDNDIYYSITAEKKTRKLPSNSTNNTLAFRLNLGQGLVTAYAPVRDSQNLVIPGQLGEFVIKCNGAYLFSVAGFHGNENLGYFCLQAEAAELYHCGLIPIPTGDPPLRWIDCLLPAHMQSTFFPLPKDLVQHPMKGSPDREMVSLAIQIKASPEQKRKRIRIAAGIQLATLRHYFSLSQHTWLTQLTDMFDVVDYPVLGYTPNGVVTELNLHVWDCAIDYRPLYFDYRTVITLGTFMVSSNIASATSGCTLRFVAEDCTMSLAPQKVAPKTTPHSTSSTNSCLPSSELVCIIDLGLFEISLRLHEKVTSSFPKFDLRASINDVHLRTCSDSGRALAQFIAYIAAEGDFDIGDDQTEGDTMSVASEVDSDLLSVKSTTSSAPEVTPKQQQRVNTLMAEAMEESLRIISSGTTEVVPAADGVKIFFFPDEASTLVPEQQQKPPPAPRPRHPSLHDELTSSVESLADCKKIRHATSSVDCDDESVVNTFDKSSSEETSSTKMEGDVCAGSGSGECDSINTEMRELFDFETSVMGMASMFETETVEALPQVSRDLGEVKKIQVEPKPAIRTRVGRKISSDTDEDFCFIAEEEKVDYSNRMQEVSMSEDPIRIIDNHFSVPNAKPDLLQAPKGFPMAVVRYTLCEMSLIWHLYGGHDFMTDEERAKKFKKGSRDMPRYQHLPMSDAYKMGVSFSKGSPKVQFGISEKLTWKTQGGTARQHDKLMEFYINKVRFSHETYPNYTEQASRQVLLVTELEIRDKMEVSNINKFLYHPAVGPKSKHGSHHMVVIKALHLRPDASLPQQECCLRVSLLPLRLNIDQDSLEFLVTFFTDIAGDTSASADVKKQTPSHQPPVMTVDIPEAAQELQARKMVSDNLLLLMEDEDKDHESNETCSEVGDTSPVYFRNIVFGPEVPIRFDYHGKHVEFNRGPIAGLVMGLGQLQCSEIKLKAISYRHGILGVDRLLNFLLQEWLQDIKRNQLPSILSGVGPMHSLVQLFQGIRDLFWLPIEQYQKDGRFVRGLQLGAQSFTARTALAALEITTRIIHLLQITAETAYDMVSPGPSVRRGRGKGKGKRKRFNPPQDIREGVASAFQIVKDGIGETAHQIVDVTALEHDQKGYTGAVGAIVRQIPPTVVRPLVLVTQATSNILGGVRNQLVPDARVEAKEKWKDDDDDSYK